MIIKNTAIFILLLSLYGCTSDNPNKQNGGLTNKEVLKQEKEARRNSLEKTQPKGRLPIPSAGNFPSNGYGGGIGRPW